MWLWTGPCYVFPKLVLGVYTASSGPACWRRVDGAFVNGLFSQQRKNIWKQSCKNSVKLILRTSGVCSCQVWLIGKFGGTFSLIFMAKCYSVKSHRCAVWSPPYKRNWRILYCITTEEEVWKRSVKLQVLENDLEQKDFVMTELFTSASRLVRGTK